MHGPAEDPPYPQRRAHPSQPVRSEARIILSGRLLTVYLHCVNTENGLHLGEAKNRRNRRLHGIAFEDAVRIFDGPTVEAPDDRFDYGEDRVYAIGLVNGLEITVIYADRKNDERRIISAWRSEPHERRRYWQNVEA